MEILIGVGACAFVALIIVALIYNSLISKKNQVENVFASTDAILQKRFDLIPNLVSTVKGYAKHEAETFEQIAAMRSGRSTSDNELMDADRQSAQAVGRLMAIAEAYPELKADQHFMHLQKTLVEVEEQISAARRAFNAAVTDYNNACEMFPTNVFANMFGHSRRMLFQTTDAARKPVDVGDLSV
jgi:LemA protein